MVATSLAQGPTQHGRVRSFDLILNFRSRSMLPAACNCAHAHSSSTSPTFPSLRRSLSANSSISRRKSWQTRRLICAFHSPMLESPVPGELAQSLRTLSEQSRRAASRLQLLETPLQENRGQISERALLLLGKRNHFCPQIAPHSERNRNLPFAHASPPCFAAVGFFDSVLVVLHEFVREKLQGICHPANFWHRNISAAPPLNANHKPE
jgi:hypothetical protein